MSTDGMMEKMSGSSVPLKLFMRSFSALARLELGRELASILRLRDSMVEVEVGVVVVVVVVIVIDNGRWQRVVAPVLTRDVL